MTATGMSLRMLRGSSCGEMAVAREAIVLARAAAGQQGRHHRTAHVGYYLIGRGRLHLESMVGCRLSLKTRLKSEPAASPQAVSWRYPATDIVHDGVRAFSA